MMKLRGILWLIIAMMVVALVDRPADAAGTKVKYDLTGLVTVTSPQAGKLPVTQGQATASVTLEVRFGKMKILNYYTGALISEVDADPATFTGTLSGLSSAKDAFQNVVENGVVVGKRAVVTIPVVPNSKGIYKKYTFTAKVKSKSFANPANPAKTLTKSVTAKRVFTPGIPVAPTFTGFRISNPAGNAGGAYVVKPGVGAMFTANLADTDGGSLTYTVEFGDGAFVTKTVALVGTAATFSESHAYANPGNFTARLVVSDGVTANATGEIAVRVNAAPVAKIKISPAGGGTYAYKMTMDGIDSTDPENDALTYAWNFGDNTTGAGASVEKIYPNPGSKKVYTVTLTATDAYGATATAQGAISMSGSISAENMLVVTTPVKDENTVVENSFRPYISVDRASMGADFDVATLLVKMNNFNVTSYFTAVTDIKRGNRVIGLQGNIPLTLVDAKGKPVVRLGGDNNTLRVSGKTKYYTTPGGTTRRKNDSDNVRFTVTQNQRPTAAFTFTPAEPIEEQAVSFSAAGSSDPEGSPLSYAWDFGDGSAVVNSTSAGASHTYALDGTYTVKLTVSDGIWSASVEQNVVVLDKPVDPPQQGNPILTLEPSQLEFGDLDGDMSVAYFPFGLNPYYTNAAMEKIVKITNTGDGVLKVSSVFSNSSRFAVFGGATVPELSAGQSHYVSVFFTRPTAPTLPSDWSATIQVNSNASNQTLPATGRLVSSVATGSLRVRNTSNSSAAVLNFGGIMGDVPSLDKTIAVGSQNYLFNQGAVPVNITGVEVVGDDASQFSAVLVSNGQVLSGRFFGGKINVKFSPRGVTANRRMTAKLIVHTDGDQDQEIGLVGVGKFEVSVTVGVPRNFEFWRQNINKTTTYCGTDIWAVGAYLSKHDAKFTIKNVGNKPVTVTMTKTPVSSGSSDRFSFDNTTFTLNPAHPEQIVNVTFQSGSTAGVHHSLYANVTFSDPAVATRTNLLHGFTKGNNAVGVLGTTSRFHNIAEGYYWHFTDGGAGWGTSVDETPMVGVGPGGTTTGRFGDLLDTHDPYVIDQDETNPKLDMDAWSMQEQSDLVVVNNVLYTLDGDALAGDYESGGYPDPDTNEEDGALKAHTKSRNAAWLAAGGVDPAYGTGILLKNTGAISNIDAPFTPAWDIYAEGLETPEIDVTPDGAIFFTEDRYVPNASGVDVLRSRLKYISPSGTTKVTVHGDMVQLLTGVVSDAIELVEMRVIQLPGGNYRLFTLWDNDDVYDIDVTPAGVVAATKKLNSVLTPVAGVDMVLPEVNFRVDRNGFWWMVTEDGNGKITVHKRDLHTGAYSVFANAQLPNSKEYAYDVQFDNTGHVLVNTSSGIYWFSPSGQPMNFVLTGSTFYSNDSVGSDEPDYNNAEWDMDFEVIWFDK